MTLCEVMNDHADPTEAELREILSGNICRGTGYQNIVKSAMQALKALRTARK